MYSAPFFSCFLALTTMLTVDTVAVQYLALRYMIISHIFLPYQALITSRRCLEDHVAICSGRAAAQKLDVGAELRYVRPRGNPDAVHFRIIKADQTFPFWFDRRPPPGHRGFRRGL